LKLKAHDRLTTENSELHAKVKLVQLDKEKLDAEIVKVGFTLIFVSTASIKIFLVLL